MTATLPAQPNRTPGVAMERCRVCVLDTSDPLITFDADGVCNHCLWFREVQAVHPTGARAERMLHEWLARIKAWGREREYDCLIGLSGGVDSTYLAMRAKDWGLRPLALHVDSGWNSELAVGNIEQTVKRLDLDLVTWVVDWDEMRDLQLAFFRASLAGCDAPQDQAFVAALLRVALKHDLRYVLSGTNIATEAVMPSSWGYRHSDLRQLRAVHRQYGTRPLRDYPTANFFQRFVWWPHVRGIKFVEPLNLVPYEKAAAKQEITARLGWRDYGGKHYESVFTRFFQGYYLPTKFGYDKRKAHLSNLILAGQITREHALEALEQPAYDSELLRIDKAFVAKKLGISQAELDRLFGQPARDWHEFPNNDFWYRVHVHAVRVGGPIKRLLRRRP